MTAEDHAAQASANYGLAQGLFLYSLRSEWFLYF